MNENQLRTWRPRRPSATLKERIFSVPATPKPAATHWLWGGLVPTTACALLTLAVIHYNGENLGLPPGRSLVLPAANGVVSPVDGERSVQNHLAAVTFEWTNRSEFTSSIGFTPNTNLSN